MNIKDEIEVQLKKIVNIVPEIQKLVNETKVSIDEKNCEKAEELIGKCKNINIIIDRLMEVKREAEQHIKLANTQKEEFPLVPIEDINPNFQNFLQEIEDINDFYNLIKEYNFLELYEELKEMVYKYETEEIEYLKEQTRKEIKEFFNGPKDYKGKGAKIVIKDPYLANRQSGI